MNLVRIVHFSDLLCVWAYVAARRMTELHDEFGGSVDVSYRFVSVFGAARPKLEDRWRDKGGLPGYAEHVRRIVGEFDHVTVHPDVWTRATPSSSWPAHLVVSAVRLLEAEGRAAPGSGEALTWALREAFFRDAEDVSRQEVLSAAIEARGIDPRAVAEHVSSGSAHAALAGDYEAARDQDVRMSPSLVLDGGRQRLQGNVGYRVIAANVREMLEERAGQASWC